MNPGHIGEHSHHRANPAHFYFTFLLKKGLYSPQYPPSPHLYAYVNNNELVLGCNANLQNETLDSL